MAKKKNIPSYGELLKRDLRNLTSAERRAQSMKEPGWRDRLAEDFMPIEGTRGYELIHGPDPVMAQPVPSGIRFSGDLSLGVNRVVDNYQKLSGIAVPPTATTKPTITVSPNQPVANTSPLPTPSAQTTGPTVSAASKLPAPVPPTPAPGVLTQYGRGGLIPSGITASQGIREVNDARERAIANGSFAGQTLAGATGHNGGSFSAFASYTPAQMAQMETARKAREWAIAQKTKQQSQGTAAQPPPIPAQETAIPGVAAVPKPAGEPLPNAVDVYSDIKAKQVALQGARSPATRNTSTAKTVIGRGSAFEGGNPSSYQQAEIRHNLIPNGPAMLNKLNNAVRQSTREQFGNTTRGLWQLTNPGKDMEE